jgi:hypothetical protein
VNQRFDHFVDHHPDRELRDLGALKVKRQLRDKWDCKSGDDAKRRDGGIMVYGVKWPPLGELRALFIERHGPQDWLDPGVTEWPTREPTQTEADAGKADEADATLDMHIACAGFSRGPSRPCTVGGKPVP